MLYFDIIKHCSRDYVKYIFYFFFIFIIFVLTCQVPPLLFNFFSLQFYYLFISLYSQITFSFLCFNDKLQVVYSLSSASHLSFFMIQLICISIQIYNISINFKFIHTLLKTYIHIYKKFKKKFICISLTIIIFIIILWI